MKVRTLQQKATLLQIWSGGDIVPNNFSEVGKLWETYGAQADKWEREKDASKSAKTKSTGSYIGYCKRGGMQGICVTDEQLGELAKELNIDFLDMYILLPGMSAEQQAKLILEKVTEGYESKMENCQYWERTTGAHGWCCKVTGKVMQWG